MTDGLRGASSQQREKDVNAICARSGKSEDCDWAKVLHLTRHEI